MGSLISSSLGGLHRAVVWGDGSVSVYVPPVGSPGSFGTSVSAPATNIGGAQLIPEKFRAGVAVASMLSLNEEVTIEGVTYLLCFGGLGKGTKNQYKIVFYIQPEDAKAWIKTLRARIEETNT